MSLPQILLTLRARWRSASLVFALVAGLILAATLLLPKRYVASSLVVLDVKTPDPIAGVVLQGIAISGYMATQVDVLQSERVMLRAIRELQLDRDAALRAEWQETTEGRGEFEPWLAQRMLKRLEAKPGKESNVILVSFAGADPQAAAQTVNAIVGAYIETTLELRTDAAKRFNAFFGDSTQGLRQALEATQTKLSAFQQANGIVGADERFDIENARLSELSIQLIQVQGLASESGSRESEAALRGDQMQEVVKNELVMNLGADLARQEARLQELGARLGSQHPQVQELTANIRELRSRLSTEKKRITGGLAVNNTVNQARLASLRSAVEAQRSKVLKMKTLRDEAAVLQRDVENAQRGYDASFAKRSQSALESQATQTNVSVLKTATAPAFAASPRLALNGPVAILLGLVLGIATAVTRERLDGRLRTNADVLDALKLPLLGVLPDRARAAGARRLRPPPSLAAQRILGLAAAAQR